jgi:hypothetical protein
MKRKPVKKKAAKPKVPERRNDYMINDELISMTFTKLWLQHKKVPSYEDIARELNINVSTVKRHVKDMNFDERFQKFRCVSDQVIMNVFKNASTGKNARFAEMWLELFEGLGKKKEVKLTGELMKVYQGFDPEKV